MIRAATNLAPYIEPERYIAPNLDFGGVQRRLVRRRQARRVGAVAAAALAIVSMIWPLVSTKTSSEPAKPAAIAERHEAVDTEASPEEPLAATVETLTLADGSTITHDSTASIEQLQGVRTRGARVLEGAATFEVAKQPKGERFQVVSADVTVTVVGTRFTVSNLAGTVAVDVEEGIVEVRQGERIRRLTAGDSWRGGAGTELAQLTEPAAEAVAKPTARAPKGPAARVLFKRARSAQLAGDYTGAVRGYAALMKAHPRSRIAGQGALEKGQIERDQLGRTAAAAKSFTFAAKRAGKYQRDDAQAALVRLYDSTGKRAKCKKELRRYQRKFRTGQHRGSLGCK
ncbi:MAG: FecR domain-containing protein [Myxococcota bacterium]